jgi:hypothetical protein
MAISLVSM